MNTKQTCLSAFVLIASTSFSVSWAGDHKHRSHGAHVHGEAKLTLALEGNTLEISLESPSVNIVGFEHRASNAEQAHVVEEAEAVLKSAQQLFTFSGTRCDVKGVTVDVSSLENEDFDHHDHHEDEHDDHKDKHKHHEEGDGHHDEDHGHHDKDHGHHDEDHAHHDKEHGHHDEDHAHHDKDHGHDDTHSEITAEYSFSCVQGAKLRSITVKLLDKFPGIEEMDAMWITEAGQGAAELSADSKKIRFR